MFLGTLKWYSVISLCPVSPTVTLSYEFSITPVFITLKLNLEVFAVYFDCPSSFTHVKSNIWYLYDDFFSAFPLISSHVQCQRSVHTIIVYQKRNYSKYNIGESRKKIEESSDEFLIMVIIKLGFISFL